MPDPAYQGDPSDAPLITAEAYAAYLNGLVNTSWQLSQNNTGHYVSENSGVVLASLDSASQRLQKEIDDRINALRDLKGDLFGLAVDLDARQSADLGRFNAMDDITQNSPAGQKLLGQMESRRHTMTLVNSVIAFVQDEIDFLGQFKEKVRKVFVGAIASIQKDYPTSGGPGREFYQNDIFYFV